MPSIVAHGAAPCASASVTLASVGSHHAGDIVAAPCASAAVTPASVGSHDAGGIVAADDDIKAAPWASAAVTPASVGSHHAGGIVAAVGFYNAGVLNSEVTGKNWKKTRTGKAAELERDIHAMFASDHGIEVLDAPRSAHAYTTTTPSDGSPLAETPQVVVNKP